MCEKFFFSFLLGAPVPREQAGEPRILGLVAAPAQHLLPGAPVHERGALQPALFFKKQNLLCNLVLPTYHRVK